MIRFALIITLVTFIQAQDAPKDKILTSPTGLTIKVIDGTRHNYTTALRTCESINGTLPRLRNRQDSDWLRSQGLTSTVWLGSTTTGRRFNWIGTPGGRVHLSTLRYNHRSLDRNRERALTFGPGRTGAAADYTDNYHQVICEMLGTEDNDETDDQRFKIRKFHFSERSNRPSSELLNSMLYHYMNEIQRNLFQKLSEELANTDSRANQIDN